MIVTMNCKVHLDEVMTLLLTTLDMYNNCPEGDVSSVEKRLDAIISTLKFFDLNVYMVTDPANNNKKTEVVICNPTIELRGTIDCVDPACYTLHIQ